VGESDAIVGPLRSLSRKDTRHEDHLPVVVLLACGCSLALARWATGQQHGNKSEGPSIFTPKEEFARDARGWARQTIIFTLQYGLGGAETAAEEQAELVRLSDESVEIINRLWATAEGGPTELSQLVHKFIRLTLEWSSEHVRRKRRSRAASG
jgi:hypothetical protein